LALTQIANEKMAGAIRKNFTQSGHDPSEYTIFNFCGAGGQHAFALARMVGMKKNFIPYYTGLLSAYGNCPPKIEKFNETLLLMPLEEAVEKFHSFKGDRILAYLRFKGQENSIEIDLGETDYSLESILSSFRKKYERIFGHWIKHPIEVESVKVFT